MIISFNGIDNVGKTTQIELLQAKLKELGYPVHYMHYGSSWNEEQGYKTYTALYQMLNSFQQMFNSKENFMILDRDQMGENVYGPLYRNYDKNFDNSELTYTLKNTDDIIQFVFLDDAEKSLDRDDGLSHSVDLEKRKLEIEYFTKAYIKSKLPLKFLININDERYKADTIEASIDLIHREIWNIIHHVRDNIK